MTDWSIKAFPDLTGFEVYALFKLRQDIFCLEQNCLYTDIDELDPTAHHITVWQKDKLLACSRCLPPGTRYQNYSSIGRVAVRPPSRGQKLGRLLMARSIAFNFEHYPDNAICISAQLHLQAFYSSLGFAPVGEDYYEEGIKHIKMLLTSAPTSA